MGILDDLGIGGAFKDIAGQLGATAMPAVISAVLAKTNLGDLNGLVDQLRSGGLGAQVGSWLGQGQNLPVSPDQLRGALSQEQLGHIAQQLGIPADQVLKMLSQHLPGVVDKASPKGVIENPPEDLADEAGSNDVR